VWDRQRPESKLNAYNDHKVDLWLYHLMWIRSRSRLGSLFLNFSPDTCGSLTLFPGNNCMSCN